jgi:hypothetical protein
MKNYFFSLLMLLSLIASKSLTACAVDRAPVIETEESATQKDAEAILADDESGDLTADLDLSQDPALATDADADDEDEDMDDEDADTSLNK